MVKSVLGVNHQGLRDWLFQRMSAVLSQLYPNASAHLQIAARAQHMERWKSLRNDYPEGRAGYKKWRAELGLFHATRAAECMTLAGYRTEDCDRVKYLVQKRQIKRDEEKQLEELQEKIKQLMNMKSDDGEKVNKDIKDKQWRKDDEKVYGLILRRTEMTPVIYAAASKNPGRIKTAFELFLFLKEITKVQESAQRFQVKEQWERMDFKKGWKPSRYIGNCELMKLKLQNAGIDETENEFCIEILKRIERKDRNCSNDSKMLRMYIGELTTAKMKQYF